MSTASTVRDQLDDVVDDLIVTLSGDHTGHELTPTQVQALIAFLSDLRDKHDEQAIDVDLWPTLAGFCDEYLLVVEDKPCDRTNCRVRHFWTGGRCPGNSTGPATDVTARAAEARDQIRGAR